MRGSLKVGIGFLVTACLLFLLAGLIYTHPLTYIAHGKMSFASEDAYLQFKTFLSQNYVAFRPQDVTVLSSSPPIVVSFDNVIVTQGKPFPYGSHYFNAGITVLPMMFGAITLIISVVALGDAWLDHQKELSK